MKKAILLPIFFLMLAVAGQAQITDCGTDALHAKRFINDPQYKEAFKQQQAQWARFITEKNTGAARMKLKEGEVYEIPVVVHIIHTGEPVGHIHNPSDSIVRDRIQKINDIFSGSYPLSYAAGTRVPIPIRLKLAQRNPECTPTTGINRVNGSNVPGYIQYGIANPGSAVSPGAQESALKSLSIWPSKYYLNIWVVIKGAQYAYLPSSDPSPWDGIVVISNEGNPFHEYVLAHEIGHSFGLLHTFEGAGTNPNVSICPPNVNCLIDGDGVCDTDPHPFIGCADTSINRCTNTPYVQVKHNMMNYGCFDRFTAGQRERMIFMLERYRYSLLTSLGALPPFVEQPPVTSVPLAACKPVGRTDSVNFTFGPTSVQLADLSVQSGGYAADGFRSYVDHTVPLITCVGTQQPRANLNAGQVYELKVITDNIDAHNVRGWIDFNNDGVFQSTELVISSNGTTSYQTHIASFTVPNTGVPVCTPLRMRISANAAFYPAPQPCLITTGFASSGYGQAEDFIVVVNNPAAPIPAVTIAADQGGAVCAGTNVTFTAVPVNGGASPTFQWKKNGVVVGTSSNTFSSSELVNGDLITCSMTTSPGVCAAYPKVNSNYLTMTVNAVPSAPTITQAVGGQLTSSAASGNQWFLNGSPIAGATGKTYTATVSGTYTVQVTVNNCKSSFSQPAAVVLTSVTNLVGEKSIQMFPNPVKDFLAIRNVHPSRISITILDLAGRVVLTFPGINSDIQLPVYQLIPGCYFIRVINERTKENFSKLLIKE